MPQTMATRNPKAELVVMALRKKAKQAMAKIFR
jgi:hypothetical protein